MQTVTTLETKIKKHRGPKVSVELPVKPVRKYFAIKEPIYQILAQYTAFLSEYHKQKIEEDSIIESLILKIANDRDFKSWKARSAT